MITGFIVLGRFAMMVGGALMVIGGALVVLATLMRLFAHVALLLLGCTDGGETATESDTRVNGSSHRRCRNGVRPRKRALGQRPGADANIVGGGIGTLSTRGSSGCWP